MNWDAKLFALHLNTRRFGRQEKYFLEVDSTNRWMVENWREFTLPGAIAISEHQTSGRGRFHRKWEDQHFKSLLFSLLLIDNRPRVEHGFHQMLPAIALARVLEKRLAGKHSIVLKWPNDVLLNGRKIAGILAERITEGDKIVSIVGMGINVNQQREDFPRELSNAASSIAFEAGEQQPREILLAELLNEWEPLHDLLREGKTDQLREEWLKFGPLAGSTITRREHGKEVAGVFEGLGPFGQLLLRDENGALKEFFSGDIVL